MNAKEIGERVRAYREARNMSKNFLANQAGVSPTYIYQIESGLKCPTVEYLDHICWGLGITLAEFFSEEKPKAEGDALSCLNERQKKLLNEFLKSL